MGPEKVKEAPESSVEERFAAVVESFGHFLRQAIARLCPKDLGLGYDDIEQEARLRLWRALESEREIQNLASYLYTIAATSTIDAVRCVQARNEQQLETGEAAENEMAIRLTAESNKSPERLAERHELIEKVRSAFAQLPEKRRQAVGLYLRGMSNQEIADLLGWSEPKARNLLYRGLKEMREILHREGIEYQE